MGFRWSGVQIPPARPTFNPLASTTSPFGQWPRPAPRVQSVWFFRRRIVLFATLAELHFSVYIGLTSTRRTHVLQPPGRTCLSCALEGDVPGLPEPPGTGQSRTDQPSRSDETRSAHRRWASHPEAWPELGRQQLPLRLDRLWQLRQPAHHALDDEHADHAGQADDILAHPSG